MERKLSLAQAATDVERLLDEYRADGGNLDSMITDDYKGLRDFSGVSDAVNRNIYRMGSLDMYVDKAEKEYKKAKEILDELRSIKRRAEEHLFAVVRSVSFPLKGDIGEIVIEQVGRPKVRFSIPVIESKSFSNLLNNLTDEEMKSIDQKFITRTEVFTVNKNEIAKAIKDGEKITFASMAKDEEVVCKTNQSLLS